MFIAMKNHFSTKNDAYDYIKYRGRVSIPENTYLKRKDRSVFKDLSKKYTRKELENYFLSVFLSSNENGTAIARGEFLNSSDLLSEETQDYYKLWKTRNQSLSYLFEEDFGRVLNLAVKNELKFDEIFRCIDGEYPLVMQMERRGLISIETLVILDKILDFLDRVRINDTIYWPIYKRKCKKYSGFLVINNKSYTKKVRKILLDDYYEEYGKSLEK
jgi:hypothetical protein